MTQNRRIFWNVVATYGRSLYALACGLFTARWVLMTLGEVNYGLMGVVGCLTGFIAFINSLMSGSISRYYAYSVGRLEKTDDREAALDDCRRWFNVAVGLHTVVPVLLLMIGYPIGEWAVRNYLTIPQDRIIPCVWVFRFSCLSCFVSMISCPYGAMYGAKQEIAELTVYGFVTTTLNVVFLCFMVSHPYDWMVPLSAWGCFLSVAPTLIIIVRSFYKYSEVKIIPRYLWDWHRLKQLMTFAGSRCLVSFAFLLNSNGIAVLVNKMLGPSKNAAMNIGNNVASHGTTLSQSVIGAFIPAVTNAAGAKDFNLMRQLSIRACKFCSVALLIFALPLFLEVDEVMRIWLKNPPEQVSAICICLLLVQVCDMISNGIWLAINAMGKIGRFCIVESVIWFTVMPLSWFLIKCGMGLVGVGIAFVLSKFLAIAVKLYYGRILAGISARFWVRRVFVPVLISSALALLSGLASVMTLDPSFTRIVVTTLVVEVVFLPLCWLLLCESGEREYIAEKVRAAIAKIRR